MLPRSRIRGTFATHTAALFGNPPQWSDREQAIAQMWLSLTGTWQFGSHGIVNALAANDIDA